MLLMLSYADFPGDSAAKKRENAKKRRKWTHGTVVEGRVVVQISMRWGQLVRKWEPENVDGSWKLGYDGSTVPMKDYFPIEPAFCVTIYKAQVSFDILPTNKLCLIDTKKCVDVSFLSGANNKETDNIHFPTPCWPFEDDMGRFVCSAFTSEVQ